MALSWGHRKSSSLISVPVGTSDNTCHGLHCTSERNSFRYLAFYLKIKLISNIILHTALLNCFNTHEEKIDKNKNNN